MDPNTGRIYSKKEMEAMESSFTKNFMEVEEADMTPKQKETKQVSFFDRRSMLGKRAASFRKKNKK